MTVYKHVTFLIQKKSSSCPYFTPFCSTISQVLNIHIHCLHFLLDNSLLNLGQSGIHLHHSWNCCCTLGHKWPTSMLLNPLVLSLPLTWPAFDKDHRSGISFSHCIFCVSPLGFTFWLIGHSFLSLVCWAFSLRPDTFDGMPLAI